MFIFLNNKNNVFCLIDGVANMPLASQYLLLVLYNVQAYIKILFMVTC